MSEAVGDRGSNVNHVNQWWSKGNHKGNKWLKRIAIGLLIAVWLIAKSGDRAAMAQARANAPRLNAYCQLPTEAVAQTSSLHQAALQGNAAAQSQYRATIEVQAQQLQQCRRQTWPQSQAIWIRLYPCDAMPGVLEEVFDRIVSRGYNEVYVEAFYNGQVLLPSASNATVWSSMLNAPGYENRDLLAEAIAAGHARGLKVYAWMFSLNYGYTYSQRPEAEQTMARNGRGDTSITRNASASSSISSDEAFVDPYSLQAKQEYLTLLQAVLQRRPDGVLFDYIRYPKGTGADSVASRVEDLWIYGPAAQQALYARALNQQGLEMIRRFLGQGYVTGSDLSEVASLYPQDGTPLWQGRTDRSNSATALQTELWQLSVAHAIQGVLDFLSMAVLPVQQQRIAAGAVFFPEGNQVVGSGGYDSRLQPWDRFPTTIQWHPMSYANCGQTNCVVEQVQRVISQASSGTQVQPVLAGTWGSTIDGHPPLEDQMRALRQAAPQLTSISHFAYSWQDPQYDRDRKFCQLR